MADDVSGAAADQDQSYAMQAGDLMAGVGASLPRTELGELVHSTFASSWQVMRPSTNVQDRRGMENEKDPFADANLLTRPLHTLMTNWNVTDNPLAEDLGANSVRDAAARIRAAVQARQQELDKAILSVPIATPYY